MSTTMHQRIVTMSEDKEKFLNQILKNLELNGFPAKKVSFDLMKMYELADNKGFSFNDTLEDLENNHSIFNEKTDEKIIFFKEQEQTINADMFKQAQDMLSQMDPAEIERIKDMYENMSDEEKQNIMEQAKKMGYMG